MNKEAAPTPEPYCLLRASLALFQKLPEELDDNALAQASAQARNEHELERRVLNSPEAASVMVTDAALAEAVKTVRDRFDSQESFEQELVRNGLDQTSLKQALYRQCKVESVLESIANRAADVSEVEIGIYYHLHPDKFQRPEQRRARHILITINDQYTENSREMAQQKIAKIGARLKSKPNRFSDLALKHSECPTAMQGGDLGTVPKDKLFPEIEAVLFSLKQGEISKTIETEIGFHLVKCEEIFRTETVSLKKATPKIRKLLKDRARHTCQRAWLASLSPVKNQILPKQEKERHHG